MVGKKKPGSEELNGRADQAAVLSSGRTVITGDFLNVMLFTENSTNSKDEYNMVQPTAQVPEEGETRIWKDTQCHI